MSTSSIPLSEQALSPVAEEALSTFKKTTRNYALFPTPLFRPGFFASSSPSSFFFRFLTQSTLLAFTLATLLFTAFSYFILSFYLQAKKPQDLSAIKDTLLQNASLEPTDPGLLTPNSPFPQKSSSTASIAKNTAIIPSFPAYRPFSSPSSRQI